MSIKQNTVLATTPAEFNLTSRSHHFPAKPRCPYTRNNSVRPTVSRRENITELIRLRSSAFWELRKSIAENGEGLVRRMRDYEYSRSRHNIHLKVKEAERRGRKRVSFKNRTAGHNSSDVSDDEDIQICSGDSSNNIPFRGGGRSLLDATDNDIRQLDSPSTWHIRSCPSYGPQCSSNLQLDFVTSVKDTEPNYPSSNLFSSSPPHPPYEPTKSSPILPPPYESLSLTADDLSTTSYHKVIASLNLAIANGAGSIEDYSPLWEYQSRFQTEYYDHGDLWH